MFTDQQLRQRAEELRQQLKVTIRQTRDAIESTKKLTDSAADLAGRQAHGRRVARTLQNVRCARKKLDGPRPG